MEKIIDGRNMLPPEPLENALAALAELADEDELLLLLHCKPRPLYDILRREGYRWKESTADDSTWEIRIQKAPRTP